MSQDEVSAITVIAGFVTALAALVSAFAAWKAVSHAKAASKAAEMTEKRILVREIVNGCRETLNSASRVQDLAQENLGLIKDLAVFAGQFGGSRQKLFENEVEKDRASIAAAVETINSLFSNEAELSKLEVGELNAIYATMSVQLAEVSSVRQKFEAKVTSLIEEVRPYREEAINT